VVRNRRRCDSPWRCFAAGPTHCRHRGRDFRFGCRCRVRPGRGLNALINSANTPVPPASKSHHSTLRFGAAAQQQAVVAGCGGRRHSPVESRPGANQPGRLRTHKRSTAPGERPVAQSSCRTAARNPCPCQRGSNTIRGQTRASSPGWIPHHQPLQASPVRRMNVVEAGDSTDRKRRWASVRPGNSTVPGRVGHGHRQSRPPGGISGETILRR